MRVAFDLDGTLYDTMAIVIDVENRVRDAMGYPHITRKDYLEHFQSKDFRKLCLDLGIREGDADEALDKFDELYASADIPPMVPCAKETLYRVADRFGDNSVYIVTNNPTERIKSMLDRDGLGWLLSNVRNPRDNKAGALYDIATSNCGGPAIYIGDIVSDGEACGDAIRKGATNLKFYGIMHDYAMKRPEDMVKFIMNNRDFARGITDIRDVGLISKKGNG